MVFNSPALTRSLPYRALALALALTEQYSKFQRAKLDRLLVAMDCSSECDLHHNSPKFTPPAALYFPLFWDDQGQRYLRAASTRARRAKQAGDLSQSASPQRCIALIHFRIRLRVRNADHKTMVEKNTNDGSAIGGSCRGELQVIRLGHCHAAWPTVEGPQFRKSAGGDRSH